MQNNTQSKKKLLRRFKQNRRERNSAKMTLGDKLMPCKSDD